MEAAEQDRMLVEIHTATATLAVDMTHVKDHIKVQGERLDEVEDLAECNSKILTRSKWFLKGMAWIASIVFISGMAAWKIFG